MEHVLKYCEDKYKWLFSKQEQYMDGKRSRFRTIATSPFVEDGESHWRVYREKDSSPLILSKNV